MRASTVLGAASLFCSAFAQVNYTDTTTGITFLNQVIDTVATGSLQIGIALSPDVSKNQEYIGRIAGTNPSNGWTALSHSSGMLNNLLLTIWPNGNNIVTSFRYASGYVLPDVYVGNATLIPIKSSVTATSFELIYRCLNCWSWNQGGVTGGQVPVAGGVQVLGWAQSITPPTTPADPASPFIEHDYFGLYGAPVDGATQAAYSSWSSLGASTTASPTTTATATPSASVGCTANNAAPNKAYDYIVVGAGAGGIPVAAKLAESGKSVLLIERGPPSSGRWGGTMRPSWLTGTNLTRFDVPGLCNEIWVDSAGIACPDAGAMAGCVLGGGTAINAALWWKANPTDFDYNFPTGWKSADMTAAINRVFAKIPGTYTPSRDGKLYLPQGYNAISSALATAGWQSVAANSSPGLKNRTFSHTPYMYANGERGGPMATYLVEADARPNFDWWVNTTVTRVSRTGSFANGVDVEATGPGGYCGNARLSPSGRVILSAGVFGTSKILFRSGIGPTDQLNIVQASSDSSKMIASSSWINLPVGNNLDDHTNTDTIVHVPSAVFYDFYAAFTAPNATDESLYMKSRTGILTQSAPNIGPIFWEEITGPDGIARQFQYTSRVEGNSATGNNQTMTISQYLGRGHTSRGRLTITPALTMTVSDMPYLKTPNDIAAIIQSIKNLQAALAPSPITFLSPAPGTTVEDFVANYPITIGGRTANHWIGTAKIGTDSGLVSGGTAVVDLNTKVYGTDNIFVVDASIFPGMVSTNPSALIVAVAEQASQKILALTPVVNKYAQCGGKGFPGPVACISTTKCKVQNPYYSQCL